MLAIFLGSLTARVLGQQPLQLIAPSLEHLHPDAGGLTEPQILDARLLLAFKQGDCPIVCFYLSQPILPEVINRDRHGCHSFLLGRAAS